MKEMQLSNGVKIPALGYGTWRMPGSDACVEAVLCALQTGYRHIDTAAKYENEESVGEAIRKSGMDRAKIFVTSKLWNTEHTYERTMAAFSETLARLGTDYLDLYLIHWPRPIDYADCWERANAETWRAMEELYRAGKIRAIGVSNFMPHHIEALKRTAQIAPMVNQIELHPGCLQQEAVAYCRAHHIALEAWAPFAIGTVLTHPTLCAVAERIGRTPAQTVLRWFYQQGIVALPKSATPSRMRENLQIFDFALSDADMRLISEIEGEGLPRRRDPDDIDF